MKFVPIDRGALHVRAHGLNRDAAPAQRERLDRHRRPRHPSHHRQRPARPGEARGRVQAQDVGVAARRRGVEVGRAPDASVDVLAAVDLERREQPGHRARGGHRLRNARPGRAGAAEHHAPAAGPVDRRHAQPSVEPGAVALDVAEQAVERLLGAREPPEHQPPHDGTAGRRQPERQRREARARGQGHRAGTARGDECRRREPLDRARGGPFDLRRASRSAAGGEIGPRPGGRRRSRRRRSRRSARTGAGRSRWRPRCRRGRPSSTPRRGRHRPRAREHPGG